MISGAGFSPANLIAEGIPHDGSERMPIREAEWLDLSHVHPKRGQADSFGLEGSEQPKYLSVQLRRAQVLKLWPVNGDKPPNAVTQRAKKSAAILEAVAEIWPEGVPQSLPIGERDRLIFKWFKDRERAAPVVETIRRALRGK